MRWLRRYVRRLLERVLDRTNDGPDAPRRLRDEVRLFRVLRPDATVEQWEVFARTIAENAYRDAFTRGYECGVRGVEEAELGAPDPRYDVAPSDNPGMSQILLELQSPGDPLRGTTPAERQKFFDLLRDLDRAGIPYQVLPDRVIRRG